MLFCNLLIQGWVLHVVHSTVATLNQKTALKYVCAADEQFAKYT